MTNGPLPTSYVPHEWEPAVSLAWERSKAFHAAVTKASDQQPTFGVVIPPPNVTAALHLGHALNTTLQDVLIRYHRMCGFSTMWMPGTDHAGIATQTVVEKRMLKQGASRLEMSRDAFVNTTQKWAEEYEQTILTQLKAMGASCDYERVRFTMDEMCAAAVRHAFFTLFRDGLIYRGKRLVNWDPVTQTALADDEVEMEDVDGHMWYLQYPLADRSGVVTVATTRPETMFGDTAVAVNPKDPRAAELRGKQVVLPIVGRIIPIVEDDYVVMPDPMGDGKAVMATGFLKVTPAHDPNDWDIGKRHDLPVVNVMAADASISDQYGWEDVSPEAQQFLGMSRGDARDAVVSWFRDNGLLADVRSYSHSVGHSYRSHVPIEPWLSDQWYVRASDDRLRGAALRSLLPEQAVDLDPQFRAGASTGDGELRFTPPRYAATFQKWHENLRDWCVSRQLWWGHQIPVWNRTITEASVDDRWRPAIDSAESGDSVVVDSEWSAAGAVHTLRRVTDEQLVESVCVPGQATLWRLERTDTSLEEDELVAALEAEGYERDPDVLDTWFSSALWPLSTMGWPFPEDYPETAGLLQTYNPTSVLSTAREIITLWVSRMVMFNRYFLNGQIPFRDVFVHAMVQDGHGQKMSKSLGNGVDPRDIIFSHGTDAMRFTLVQMTTDTQDVRLPVEVVCPYTGESFTPEFITTSSGHVVAAPEQSSPSDRSNKMTSAYGVASGAEKPSQSAPLARNTSTKFDSGRNFVNKLFNAVKFALHRLEGVSVMGKVVDIDNALFADRYILARLHETVATCSTAIENYQFNVYADTLYDFVWREVCDVYLEAVKPTIDDDPTQQVVLGVVLDAVLRLMHPVCPFVTEALWPSVTASRIGSVDGVHLPACELLAVAEWPAIDGQLADADLVDRFARSFELITQIRSVRSQQTVSPKKLITVHAPQPVLDLIASADGLVQTLAGVDAVLLLDSRPPQVSSSLAFEGSQVFLSGLAAEVDLDVERKRLSKVIADRNKQIAGFQGKLANDGYINGAPATLVQETREKLTAAEADLAAAEAALARLTE